jgi:N-glycosylase/DNA lyase
LRGRVRVGAVSPAVLPSPYPLPQREGRFTAANILEGSFRSGLEPLHGRSIASSAPLESISVSAAIRISAEELSLDRTLAPGQSFRWKQDSRGMWIGVVGRKVVRVRREGEEIRHEAFPGAPDEALIRDYFRLEVRLRRLHRDFVRADPRIGAIIERLKGLRVLRQDPEETLLSYICTTAKSVPQITAGIEALCREYGEHIATVDGREYHSFPTAQALAEADVEDMSALCRLGFRCANLRSVAGELMDRPSGWLNSLREASYEEARAELLRISHVGMKIADCVLLFSLDKDQAFPVDTHIRRVAAEHYLPELREKTITTAVYQRIAEYFQCKFGPYAGWAQNYLYYDDLLSEKA